MKVVFRGHSDFTEVPDQPTAPISPGPTIARGAGAEAPADTLVTSDHSVVTRADSGSMPVLTSFAAAPASTTVSSAQLDGASSLAVPSALTDIQPLSMTHGDAGGSSDLGGGSGEIARDGGALASLAIDGPGYADHGWFVVPSTSNEYGEAAAYAAADGFSFDAVAGEFSSDWFLA